MFKKHDFSPVVLKSIVSLVAAPVLLTTVSTAVNMHKTLAQTSNTVPSFSLPSSLPNGTTLKISGSSTMNAIDQALKQRFIQKFPGTRVDVTTEPTDQALQALSRGNIDLAGIGRALTTQEKDQGLKEVPISREKIAIIVGPDNPFTGNLTFDQFAKIFRGEIKDWSQVGGPPGPIRVVDRPNFSDTRQALSTYQVFKTAPFKTGANATQVASDDTTTVVRNLGKDGISYAIASQVLNQKDVRVLPLHNTLPSDPRYPYSEPLSYVYKGEPSPGARAFLGFATSQAGQQAVQEEKRTEAQAVGNAVVTSPSPVATTTPAENRPGFPWWVFPIVAVGGGLLWLLTRGRGETAPGLVAAPRRPEPRIILTPRNCQDAYAYWEVPAERFEELKRQGGRNLKVRLYDVTGIPDMERQTLHSVREFDCDERSQDLHMPVTRDDRDYIAELGYLTNDGHWLQIARSAHVRVPACPPVSDTGIGTTAIPETKMTTNRFGTTTEPVFDRVGDATKTIGAGIAGGAVATGAGAALHSLLDSRSDSGSDHVNVVDDYTSLNRDCRIILVQRNSRQAYAYWEVADKYKQALRQQGGKQLALRIHDATNIDIEHELPHSSQEYMLNETEQDKHVAIPASDRDYIAELGYLTEDNRWLPLIRSFHVRISSDVKPSR